ncbi:hypothetical protein [Falsiruegeria mediterranea]|uniref:Uncharacterized protein n=1 Tax=Falsiruegeria mediterranea M17 TaxID=1200281 RepID=A0A2R8C5C2_9RHOB|nr:hypothetical protein [Falsiruegeria mediterranea]SPJ27639.1 hypothetical protein TRM7615_01129 [Falsiruegeria mediterranea M17]
MSVGLASASLVQRGVKQQVSIRGLIEWAFQRELASLDFDEIERETGARPGIGMEWIMIERARLGCRVDGGGHSDPHHDAELVASALAVLPEGVGGRRMAIRIAELARAGQCPDWRRDAEPRCEPLDWRQSKHGRFAHREFCRDLGGRWPADSVKGKDWGYWCPVTFTNTAREIAACRREYLAWRLALMELRNTFQILGNLTVFIVTETLPALRPWGNDLE